MDSTAPNDPQRPDPGPEPQYLEIHLGRKRKWKGMIAYGVFYLAVCGIVAWFLYYFTRSWVTAAGLVVFMAGYMTIAGWLASRHLGMGEEPGHGRR